MKKARVLSVLGTRPEIIKFSPLLPLLDRACAHAVVHTGQHYDPALDRAFFRDLRLRAPDHRLGIGSLPPAQQLGRMTEALGELFARISPRTVLVLGDTNSALAAALAAVKTGARLVHLEAGCRSRNGESPEEQNRKLIDHVSHLHCVPDPQALRNLRREGITETVVESGSTVLEAAARALASLDGRKPPAFLPPGAYALATLHRAENTREASELRGKLALVGHVAASMPVVFPVHPRTRKLMKSWKIPFPRGVEPVEPLGYLDFLGALRGACCVLSDSGGIQEEAALAGVPCMILREETEWTRYVRLKRNFLVGGSLTALKRALAHLDSARARARRSPLPVPDASRRILRALEKRGFLL